jgi:hypothetical protein
MSEIRGGIEWFRYECEEGEAASCARCGGDAEFVNCSNCGGEGYSHHDCGEDCCCCLNPEDNVVCNWCRGECGSWHCTNSPDWCQSHPLPGREAVGSTAMRAEAWNDV